MPIVRIAGTANAKTQWLVEQLRTRGYEVDLSGPGESAGPPADLEMSVETCTAEEALAQAEAFSREKPEGRIFVDCGVMPDLPIQSEPQSHLQPERWWRRWFARARVTSTPAVLSVEQHAFPAELSPPQPAETSLSNTADLGPSAATAPIPPIPSAAPPPVLPHPEFAAIVADERSRWHSVLRRQEEFRQAELERLAKEAEQREEQRKAREAEVERRNREAEAEVLRMAAEAEQLTLASPVSLPDATPSAAPDALDVCQEKTTFAVPDPLTDLTSIPAGAHSERRVPGCAPDHELLPALPPADPVVIPTPTADFVAPVSTPGQPPQYAVPEIRLIDRPVEVRMPARAAGPNASAPSELDAATALRRVFVPRRRRRTARTLSPRAREWRIAVISAAAFTVILMGAWSFTTSPQPAAPLSLRELQQSNRIQQEVPFGPVRITNLPAVIAPAPPAAIKTGPTVAVPGEVRAVPARRSQPKPSAYKKRAAAQPSGTAHDAPNDVVVRHFAPAARRQPEPAQAKAGLRHISDLD